MNIYLNQRLLEYVVLIWWLFSPSGSAGAQQLIVGYVTIIIYYTRGRLVLSGYFGANRSTMSPFHPSPWSMCQSWSAHHPRKLRFRFRKHIGSSRRHITWCFSLIRVAINSVYWLKVVSDSINSLMGGCLYYGRTWWSCKWRIWRFHRAVCPMWVCHHEKFSCWCRIG